MTENTQIKLFEDKKVRTIWDKEGEEWYFSVVDVVAILTESSNPKFLKSSLLTNASNNFQICCDRSNLSVRLLRLETSSRLATTVSSRLAVSLLSKSGRNDAC